MITLFDKATNKKLAYLDAGIVRDSISVRRSVNGELTARFDYIPHDNDMALTTQAYAEIDGLLFDISYLEQIHGHSITYSAQCEHVIYRLIDVKVLQQSFQGTASQILSAILNGTEFSVGIVDFNDYQSFEETRADNALDLLRQFAGFIGAKLEYDGFSVNLRNNLFLNQGFTARFGKNITEITRIVDHRKGLTYYQLSIVNLAVHPDYADIKALETIAEGDKIRIVDDSLNLDAEQIVVSRTYNPLDRINISLEIANKLELFTDNLTIIEQNISIIDQDLTELEANLAELEENAVLQDKEYYGVSISKENGIKIIREDGGSEALFNSDIFRMSALDDDGKMVDCIYFDPLNRFYKITGRVIIDGDLIAQTIISENIISESLYAENGVIADLTVNSLRTDYRRVQRYINGDTSPLNYTLIYDEVHQMITAETDGLQAEQFTNANGVPLWWKHDEIGGITTTEETNEPVMVYVYDELVKFDNSFTTVSLEDGNNAVTPLMKFGAGTGVGDNGKLLIWKAGNAAHIKYITSSGTETELRAEDDGKWYYNDVEIADNGGHKIVDSDNVELPQREMLKFNNSVIVDDEEANTTIVTPMARIWKHLHIASNYFTVTWENDEQDNYLLEFHPDGRVSAIISLERRWTFSYE